MTLKFSRIEKIIAGVAITGTILFGTNTLTLGKNQPYSSTIGVATILSTLYLVAKKDMDLDRAYRTRAYRPKI
jgi:hypothetical protein